MATSDNAEITNEEEMKEDDTFEEPSLLRRVSSNMQVDPYNRTVSLAKAVHLLKAMIDSTENREIAIREHIHMQTGISQEQFKLCLKDVFNLCTVQNLEV